MGISQYLNPDFVVSQGRLKTQVQVRGMITFFNIFVNTTSS
jgi:hypothetical protein